VILKNSNQRFKVLEGNYQGKTKTFKFAASVDKQRDDSDLTDLIDPKDLAPISAEVDHVLPAELGGCNTPQNAQVLSASNNASKGMTYPWGIFSGSRVYDLGRHKIYNSKNAARLDGADMTTIDLTYPNAP